MIKRFEIFYMDVYIYTSIHLWALERFFLGKGQQQIFAGLAKRNFPGGQQQLIFILTTQN